MQRARTGRARLREDSADHAFLELVRRRAAKILRRLEIDLGAACRVNEARDVETADVGEAGDVETTADIDEACEIQATGDVQTPSDVEAARVVEPVAEIETTG